MLSITGAKSDNVDSPSYTPSLFSFTRTPKKRLAECSLDRWKAMQKRCELEGSENEEAVTELVALMEHELESETVGTQMDFTMRDISVLETNNLTREEEIVVFMKRSSYPTEEQLKADSKLVTFYIGISTFTTIQCSTVLNDDPWAQWR